MISRTCSMGIIGKHIKVFAKNMQNVKIVKAKGDQSLV